MYGKHYWNFCHFLWHFHEGSSFIRRTCSDTVNHSLNATTVRVSSLRNMISIDQKVYCL